MMDATQVNMEEMRKQIDSHTKRLDEMQMEISQLKDSVQRALDSLFPKVEALLLKQESNDATIDAFATNAQSTDSLFQAAEGGDVDCVLRLLADGADFLQRNENGDSALHVAASAGKEIVVAFLVGNIKVDLRGHRSRTALHCASAGGHLAVVRCLLLAGAAVDTQDCDGNSSLLLAAKAGHLDVVELLCDKGCALNLVDKDKNSAVPVAAKAEKWDVVKFLLQRGASAELYGSVNRNNKIINVPLHLIVKYKKYSLIPFVLKCIKARESEIKNALQDCNDSRVIYIFEDYAPGFCKTIQGRNCMTNFAKTGNVEMLRTMLDNGGDINGFDSNTNSCLHSAARHGNEIALKMLLDRGADVDLLNYRPGEPYNGSLPTYQTALHVAVSCKKVECVRILVEAGASLSITDHDGKTAIGLASCDEIRQILSSQS